MTTAPENVWRRFMRRLTETTDVPVHGASREDLLRRAARCFMTGKLLEDASRLYRELGELQGEALCLEQLGRYADAAFVYRRIPEPRSSARCFMQAGRYPDAGEDLVAAGDLLPGAWILAHRAQHFVRASSLVEEYPPSGPVERLAREVILARCEAGSQQPSRAALRLRDVAAGLPATAVEPLRNDVWNWGFELASFLRRPDLTASLHAARVAAGIPGAEQRWDEWTTTMMGEAVEERTGV